MTHADLEWKEQRFGWEAVLPSGCPTLFSHRLRVVVQTRSVAAELSPPQISAVAKELIDDILLNMESVVADATASFSEWAARRPSEVGIAAICEPHLWLEQDRIEEKRMEDAESMDGCPGLPWTMVVGFTNASDFGVHIEFSGCQFVEAWAGD